MNANTTPLALAPVDVQALVTLPPIDRAIVALNASAAEQHLRALVVKSSEITNVVDKNGREEAHRAAMGLKNARVAIVNNGKAVREDATAFQRAVVAEVERLAEITADEETRLLGLRDTFDKKLAAEKAERERLAAIRAAEIAAAMQSIRDLPVKLANASAADLETALGNLARKPLTEAEFGEKLPEANELADTVGIALSGLLDAALAREAAEAERVRLEAEAKRKLEEQAEAQRVEAERLRVQQAEIDAARAAASKAAQEAAAQMARQNAIMQDIMGIQAAGNMVGDARMIDIALNSVRAFDPATCGELAAMATTARDLAATALEQRMRAVLALEIPGVLDEAYAMNEQRDEVMLMAELPTPPNLVPVHEIDWDEPILVSNPPNSRRLVGHGAPVVPLRAKPDDSVAVNAFRAAVQALRKTRGDAEIVELLNDELAVMAGN